jgi:diguanylate cyclase (GGDEF)-like protein
LRFQKNQLLNLAIALLFSSLILLLSQHDILKRLELASLDFSFRLRGTLPYNKRIVIVEITDDDISNIGRWPWPRTWLAAMTKALTDLGAQTIFFDFVLSEPSSETDDELFDAAVKQSERIYLPFVFKSRSFETYDSLKPLLRFSANAMGTGSINIYPDRDGIIRKINLLFNSKDNLYLSAAMKIAMDYRDYSFKQITPRQIVIKNELSELKIPTVEENKMYLNWLGTWENTFKHYRFLDILNGYQDFKEKKETAIYLPDFKNSICLVGLTAIGLQDIKAVPVQAEYPGIGITATAISNILDNNFVTPVSPWVNVLTFYALCLIPAFLILGLKPFEEILSVFAFGATYFYLHYILFRGGLILNLSTNLIGLFATYITVSAYNFFRISLEKQKLFKMSVTDGMTGLYNRRYFDMLLETEFMLSKINSRNIFCIAMCDIDNFKNFNDKYGHQVGDLVLRNVAYTLKTAVRSSDIVARYGGEEMIVLLRGASFKDGMAVAEKMRKLVEILPLKDDSNIYAVTVSFGVAFSRLDDNPSTLIKRADEGLYAAKNAGKNRVSSIEK